MKAPLERIPFEERRAEGYWRSLLSTWKLASLEPTRFFPLVGKSVDTRSAIWFYLTVNMIAVFFYFCLGLPLRAYDLVLLTSRMAHQYGATMAHLAGAGLVVLTLVSLALTPIFLLLGFYLSAFGWHVTLLFVKGGPRGFQATARVLAYASAPGIIPCIGWIWSLILKIIGLAEAHQTEMWRPLVAYLLNLFISLVLITALVAMFFFLLWYAVHMAPH